MDREKKMKKQKITYNTRMGIVIILLLLSTGIILAGFHGSMEEREYEVQLERLVECSRLDAMIVERTLEGYIDTMQGMASFLEVHELDFEDGLKHLKHAAEKVQFHRLGLVDAQGQLRTTDGITVNISDREYLRDIQKERTYMITESENSRITGQEIFIIAIPVMDQDGNVASVLHGAVLLEEFEPYKRIEAEQAKRGIQIIDQNGTYMISNTEEHGSSRYATFFEHLEASRGDRPAKEIIDGIHKGETILFERGDEHHTYIEYLQPLGLNDWYLVTSLEKSEITDQVYDFLSRSVYPLIMKIVCVVAAACAMIIYYVHKNGDMELEKEENLRNQLLSGVDGFLVLDLQENKVLQGSEVLLAPCGEVGMVFQDLLAYWTENRIPEEYREYVENTMSIASMLADFQKGIKTRMVEYPVIRGNGRIGWTECEIKLEEEEDRLIAYHIFRDISSKKEKELSLKEEAERDFLTGLYNRSGCIKKMEQMMKADPDGSMSSAFALFDLDNFKAVNDKLGHDTGDQALKDVAHILSAHFRHYDMVCRLGGDEFVVLILDIEEEHVKNKIPVVLEKLRLVYQKGETSVGITASAGIAMIPRQGTAFDVVYKKADKALYQVKESGKNAYVIYQEPGEDTE